MDLTQEQVQKVARVPREMGLHEEVEESENRVETEKSILYKLLGKKMNTMKKERKKKRVCDIN